MNPSDTKQCCARLYESDIATELLGESFHPGGAALTERLGTILGLTASSHVVDAAAGKGRSAFVLAERFGCRVTGVEMSLRNVERATKEAARRGLSDRVRFACGDVEQLPLANASADAMICECAFCTFPDKGAAARELARVTKPGGRVGLSDVTRPPGHTDELNDLMAWIACLADAQPAASYARWLGDAGFIEAAVEEHDEVLRDMVRTIGAKLMTVEVLAGLKKIERPGFDIDSAKRMARQALDAVGQKRLGYALITGTRA